MKKLLTIILCHCAFANANGQYFRDNFLGTYTGRVDMYEIGHFSGPDRVYVDTSLTDTDKIVITDSISWLNFEYILLPDSSFSNYWQPNFRYGYFYSNGDSIFIHDVHNSPYFREWHCGRLGAGLKVVSWVPFSIFPNPCTDKIFITTKKGFERYSFSILNSLGQLVTQKSVSTPQTKTEIDLTLIPDGIYIIKIQSQKDFFTQKIVIRK